jgi:hypothetical protein
VGIKTALEEWLWVSSSSTASTWIAKSKTLARTAVLGNVVRKSFTSKDEDDEEDEEEDEDEAV